MSRPRSDRWTARDVARVIANPLCAGIGPFRSLLEGEEELVPPSPRLVEDEQWVRAVTNVARERGIRVTLADCRRAIQDALGGRVDILSFPGWLDQSVSAAERDGIEQFLRAFLASLRPYGDVSPRLVAPMVEHIDITASLASNLARSPEDLCRLSPADFEKLVCERLSHMGMGVERVGNTYRKDGGIDIVAWPLRSAIPFLLAVQAKHHRSERRRTGASVVRDLASVAGSAPFNAGLLVTNTTFTPDAEWVAAQKRHLLRLRDGADLRRWLAGQFDEEFDWRELPSRIELCPGVSISLPHSHGKQVLE